MEPQNGGITSKGKKNKTATNFISALDKAPFYSEYIYIILLV